MFRIKINQCEPPWRILTVLILAALMLAASAYPAANFRVLAASAPRIIVEDADSVQELDLVEPAETLLNLADQVMPRILIQHADQLIRHNLAQIPAKASILADKVAPRIIVQHAEQIIHRNLTQIPAKASILADKVEPRIIVQHAEQIVHRNLTQIPAEASILADRVQSRVIVQYAGQIIRHNLIQVPSEVSTLADKAGPRVIVQHAEQIIHHALLPPAKLVVSAIDKAKEAITIGKAAGLDMADAEALLQQAEGALATRDYREAMNIARQAKTTAVGIKRAAASQQIDQAKEAITIGSAAGLDMTGAEALLLQAEGALATRDYKEAIGLAQEAKIKVEEINRAMREANSSIEEARQVISQESAKGFDIVEAEHMILQAEETFTDRDYERAIELAATAKSLALDIDRDGALNHRDFAPTVHNNLIYIGALVLVLGLVALSIGISFY